MQDARQEVQRIAPPGAAGRLAQGALDRAGVGVGSVEIEPDVELGTSGVLGDAVIVVGAGQQQEAAVGQLWADRQSLPLLGRLARTFLVAITIEVDGVLVQIEELRRLADFRIDRADSIEIDRGDIGGASNVDLVDLLVGGGESRADADAPVVAFEHQKLVVIDRHQRGNSLALIGALHLICILGDGFAACQIELDNTVYRTVAATFVEHRALQHGVGVFAVGAHRQSFVATVGPLASNVAGIPGVVGLAGGAARDDIARVLESADELPATVEFIQRRAVFVGNQEVAVARIDDETFRVESIAENVRGVRGESVHGAAVLGELDGLGDLKVRDGAGSGIDVQRKPLNARFIRQGAAAGSTIGQTPPLLAVGVVVDVGEETDSALEVGAAALVEGGAGDRQAVDEGGNGMRHAGEKHADQECRDEFHTHCLLLCVRV